MKLVIAEPLAVSETLISHLFQPLQEAGWTLELYDNRPRTR